MQDQISTIYKDYMADIYRYCFARLGNKEQAEDITAETFLALVGTKDTSSIENIKLWLIGVARNKLIDKYRKAEKKLTTDTDIEIVEAAITDEVGTLEEIQIEAELLEEIKKELLNLDETTREILVLKHWEDLKFGEIAEIFAVSENTVKTKYYRGLETLKNNIEQKSQQSEKGKKIRAISIPLLFLALPKIKADAAFAPNSQFTSNLFNLSVKNSSMSNFKSWVKAHKAAVIITSCVLVALILGLVILLFARNNNGGSTTPSTSSESSATVTSTASTTVSSSETTTVSTSTVSTPTVKSYDVELRLWDIHVNPDKVLKKGKITLTTTDELTITPVKDAANKDYTAYTITGADLSISVGVPSDGGIQNALDVERPFTHNQFGQVYRFSQSNLGNSKGWTYTDLMFDDCKEKSCTTSSPAVLSAGTDAVGFTFICESSDVAKCDEIVKTLVYTKL